MMKVPVKRRGRLVLLLSTGTLVLVILWLGSAYAVAWRLTRRSRPVFAEPVPSVAWTRFEGCRLRTRDGQELGAWLGRGPARAPSVLLLHGNGGSRAQCLGRAELLARAGCTVLLVTLRAHGDSTGERNDIGYSARHDVIAAVEFLERIRPGKPIVIQGLSLGAAAAAFATAELGRRVQGYILESPYEDLKVAVRNRTENALPPILDTIAYQGLLMVSTWFLPDLDRIAPRDAVAGIPPEVPVLILAGSDDRSARPHEARALYERVRAHARLVVFKHAGHQSFPETNASQYQRLILDFISRFQHPAPGA